MEKRDALSKILAVAGAVLVWLPILAPFAFAGMRLARSGSFMFDYLMPAELFPAALLGGCLLLWAAWRARSRRGLIGWSLGLAVLFLFGSQALAVVTGLASGAVEPAGWPWALVLTVFAGFWVALLTLAVGGILLARGLPANRAAASGQK
ncbi:MAG: hypothetical protein JW748_08365 [Anaerolineales bacterium]|nr:hypothetical protein [Anaerolineales bacterium]